MTVSFRAPALLLATLLLALAAGADVSRAQTLELSPGFASLMQAAPETGQAIEAEHEGDTPGSTVVRTTTGMLYWQQGIAPSWTDGNQRLTVDASGGLLRWTGAAVAPPPPAVPVLASVSTPPDATVFYLVKDCETPGRGWDANTGNGFYGGLQESPTFWTNHGGLAYASRPDRASPEAQIRVAINGRDGIVGGKEGWGAWPACARRLGLPIAVR